MPLSPEANPLLQKMCTLDPQAFEDAQEFRGELTVLVRPERLVRAGELLRDAEGLRFRFLADLTAVDRFPNEPRFEIVYHLLSLETGQRVRLKVRVSGDAPKVASVVSVWPSAEAFECEVFDLFGVRFEGHPHLRRLFLPEDWDGHPLRKDFPTEGYR